MNSELRTVNPDPLIHLDDIKKVFLTDEIETHALAGIYLKILQGEYVAIAGPSKVSAQAPAVSIGAQDLGGVVTGPSGPEAGVWVIAETDDLGTRFAKMVVTDDQGRYVVPDLAKAKYQVWVRGYGLVDSPVGSQE